MLRVLGCMVWGLGYRNSGFRVYRVEVFRVSSLGV